MRQLAHIQNSSINVDYSILWIVATYIDESRCKFFHYVNNDGMREKDEQREREKERARDAIFVV